MLTQKKMQNSEKVHAMKESKKTHRCHTMRFAWEKESARNSVNMEEIRIFY